MIKSNSGRQHHHRRVHWAPVEVPLKRMKQVSSKGRVCAVVSVSGKVCCSQPNTGECCQGKKNIAFSAVDVACTQVGDTPANGRWSLQRPSSLHSSTVCAYYQERTVVWLTKQNIFNIATIRTWWVWWERTMMMMLIWCRWDWADNCDVDRDDLWWLWLSEPALEMWWLVNRWRDAQLTAQDWQWHLIMTTGRMMWPVSALLQ